MNDPLPKPSSRHTGRVVLFRHDRGYGRISHEKDAPIFFHVSQMRQGEAPNLGDTVEYSIAPPRHTTEPTAVDVVILNP